MLDETIKRGLVKGSGISAGNRSGLKRAENDNIDPKVYGSGSGKGNLKLTAPPPSTIG